MWRSYILNYTYVNQHYQVAFCSLAVTSCCININCGLNLQTSSTWEVTRGIIRRDGLGTRGLYRGMTALLVRDTLFNAVYFGGYYNMKIYLVPHGVRMLNSFVWCDCCL